MPVAAQIERKYVDAGVETARLGGVEGVGPTLFYSQEVVTGFWPLEAIVTEPRTTFEKGAHPGGSRGVECVVLELTPRWVPLVQLVLVKLGLQRREVPSNATTLSEGRTSAEGSDRPCYQGLALACGLGGRAKLGIPLHRQEAGNHGTCGCVAFTAGRHRTNNTVTRCVCCC